MSVWARQRRLPGCCPSMPSGIQTQSASFLQDFVVRESCWRKSSCHYLDKLRAGRLHRSRVLLSFEPDSQVRLCVQKSFWKGCSTRCSRFSDPHLPQRCQDTLGVSVQERTHVLFRHFACVRVHIRSLFDSLNMHVLFDLTQRMFGCTKNGEVIVFNSLKLSCPKTHKEK